MIIDDEIVDDPRVPVDKILDNWGKIGESDENNNTLFERVFARVESPDENENEPGTPGHFPSSDDCKYTVQRGDSLWRIAQQHYGKGSRWKEIANANGIEGSIIHPGQILTIPGFSCSSSGGRGGTQHYK